MLSRVVPGRSWTTARSSPISRLNRVDLPTLGRPTSATDTVRGSSGSAPAPVALDIRAVLVLLGRRGQLGEHLVEQVAGAAAVQRGDRERLAEAEAHQLPDHRFATGVVDLVGDDDHGGVASTQQVGHPGIEIGHPGGDVEDQQHDVGLGDRRLGLARHLGVELVAAAHPAAGVDEAERASEPLRLHLLAVPRHTGSFLDDRDARPEDPVDERGLAHVGPTDDGDERQRGRGCRCGGHQGLRTDRGDRTPYRSRPAAPGSRRGPCHGI